MKLEDTTADLLQEEPRKRPNLLFFIQDTAYEYLKTLERRTNGELLLKAQRRRHREGPGALVLMKASLSPKLRQHRLRLIHEVQLASLLNHPACVKVFGFYVHRQRPFSVLEYVEGCSLETIVSCGAMRRQPVSAPLAAYVAAELADALHYAHTLKDEQGQALGILHRNVSPRCVRVSTRTGEVKLLEWGTAYSCIVGRDETPEALRWGDIAYAAPEYLEREPMGPAADVFSLGLTLLELLTSKHLFDDGGPPKEAPPPQPGLRPVELDEVPSLPFEWLRARMRVLKPADVALATAGLPRELATVLLTALQRDPGARYPTAAAMRDALRAYLGTVPQPYGRAEVAAELEGLITEASTARDSILPTERDIYPEELMGAEAEASVVHSRE
jgi:serine/threonine-protein kinase